MKNAGRLKEEFDRVQEELKEIHVSAETGGGAVRATVSGRMRLLDLHVDPAMLSALADPANESDRTFAEDLIVGAINAALEKVQKQATELLSQRAAELGLPTGALGGGGSGGGSGGEGGFDLGQLLGGS